MYAAQSSQHPQVVVTPICKKAPLFGSSVSLYPALYASIASLLHLNGLCPFPLLFRQIYGIRW